MTRIGDRIATLDRQMAIALITRFGEAWSVSDPETALDWALAHEELGGQMFGNLAINYARRDIEAALDSVERLPAEHQTRWIETAMLSFGMNITSSQDRDRVLSALARFEDHPGYDRIVASIARSISLSPIRFNNPATIEALVRSLPEGELRRQIEAALAGESP